MLKLVVDENIAFAMDAFSSYGKVILINGRKIKNEILKDVDILIVRSVTKVDEKLLKGTAVKFVGTATIGTDHIDLDYLKKYKIAFADAKGCNADSVAEYFLAALLKIAVEKDISLTGKSIGIIGVGNVGSRVTRFSEAIGLKVLKNDPPRERAEDGHDYVSLDEVLDADIVTLHVPLNLSRIDKTYHLLNSERIRSLKTGTILINTSRGSVINNTALLNQLREKELAVCLDVWEGEPIINIELLKQVHIASAHVSGYSLEGKVYGTKLIFDALCNFLNKNYEWIPQFSSIPDNKIILHISGSIESKINYVLEHVYNISYDNDSTKKMIEMNGNDCASYFDKLRKEHPLRREFNNYTVIINEENSNLIEVLKAFRFKVQVER